MCSHINYTRELLHHMLFAYTYELHVSLSHFIIVHKQLTIWLRSKYANSVSLALRKAVSDAATSYILASPYKPLYADSLPLNSIWLDNGLEYLTQPYALHRFLNQKKLIG